MKEYELARAEDAHGSPASTPADALLALAERCEREEPSQELDEAIALVGGWETERDVWGLSRWRMIGQSTWWATQPSRYTESLDAAVTLVPDNATWEVAQRGDAEVTVLTGRFLVSDDIERYGRGAKTPAMSLCAAALRARAAVA